MRTLLLPVLPVQQKATGGHDRTLPRGRRLLPILRQMFARQRAEALSRLSRLRRRKAAADDEVTLAELLDLSRWLPDGITAKERAALKRKWATYHKDGATDAARRRPLGVRLDLESPHIQQSVDEWCGVLSQAVYQTTIERLRGAAIDIKREMASGLSIGQSHRKLTARVQEVFLEADRYRAGLIAQTEAIRAVHVGQLHYAEHWSQETGLVIRKKWLASADACPICLAIAQRSEEQGAIGLRDSFARVDVAIPQYADVQAPPAHPGCRCTFLEVEGEYTPRPVPPDAPKPPRKPADRPKPQTPTQVPGITYSPTKVPKTAAGQLGEEIRQMLATRPAFDDLQRPDVDQVVAIGRKLQTAIAKSVEKHQTKLDAFEAAFNKKMSKYNALVDAGQSSTTAARAIENELVKEYNKLLDMKLERRPLFRAAVVEHLGAVRDLGDGNQIEWELPDQTWLPIVKRGASTANGAILPLDWIKQAPKINVVALPPDGRAMAAGWVGPDRQMVWIRQAEDTETIAHELQHVVSGAKTRVAEQANHNRGRMEEAYYERRIKGPARPMKELQPGAAYDDGEVAHEASPPWGHPYMGKRYDTNGVRFGSEILTMIQSDLASDKYDLWRTDPDSYAFALGFWACLP